MALEERARARVDLSRSETETTFREIAITATSDIASARSHVETSRDRIERECEHQLAIARGDLHGSLDSLVTGVRAAHKQSRTLVEHAVQTIVGLGPESTLRRGYAVARDPENRPVGSKADAVKHPVLRVQFRDGQIDVENRDYRERTVDE